MHYNKNNNYQAGSTFHPCLGIKRILKLCLKGIIQERPTWMNSTFGHCLVYEDLILQNNLHGKLVITLHINKYVVKHKSAKLIKT